MTLKITEFELLNHGIEHSSYFPGCGCAFTPYEYVQTGIGNTLAEAIEDCLEQMAYSGLDTSDMDDRLKSEYGDTPETPEVCSQCEHSTDEGTCPPDDCLGCEKHYFVSIRFNAEPQA